MARNVFSVLELNGDIVMTAHAALAFPEDSDGFSTVELQRLKPYQPSSRSDAGNSVISSPE
jgi:hypothetical protein